MLNSTVAPVVRGRDRRASTESQAAPVLIRQGRLSALRLGEDSAVNAKFSRALPLKGEKDNFNLTWHTREKNLFNLTALAMRAVDQLSRRDMEYILSSFDKRWDPGEHDNAKKYRKILRYALLSIYYIAKNKRALNHQSINILIRIVDEKKYPNETDRIYALLALSYATHEGAKLSPEQLSIFKIDLINLLKSKANSPSFFELKTVGLTALVRMGESLEPAMWDCLYQEFLSFLEGAFSM